MMKDYESQKDEDKKEAGRISKRWDTLEKDFSNWLTYWQDCYFYIVPRKDDVNSTRESGDVREADLYDTTAIHAAETLASALHGMLTNPETQFFDITFNDPSLDEDSEVKDWAQKTAYRMYRVLNNTNFQTEIYENYIDIVSAGTACLYMGEHEDNVVHFSARALKEVRFSENNLGLIDVVYRCFKWRPYQIIEEFGAEACPDKIVKMAEDDNQDQIDVIHSVEPMSDEMKKSDPRKHEYKSRYILREMKYVLSKSGYNEFPYAMPRWSKVSGEVPGRGPGMSMLADIKMANQMMLSLIDGAQMAVAPPIAVQDDSVIGDVRLVPSGITVVRPGAEMPRPLVTGSNIQFGQNVVEDVRNRIRAGFMVDKLNLQQGPQMTAEEVRQRTEETLRLMGPVLGRQHFELLRPLITRLFGIMYRRGMIDAPPGKIQGKNFDVRYSSMIARAQRMTEANNYGRAMQLVAPLVQINPQIAGIMDMEKTIREIWDIFGLPHDTLLSSSAFKKKQEAQAQAQAQQQQMMQQQHEAEVVNKAAPMVAASQKGQENVSQR